ncbi:MAG: N-acyl homoserine lactonase family protein [Chloroflexi bacterium]|nr:N-acyl homoserine lactonase family protein [Chloroflexota bacterium]
MKLYVLDNGHNENDYASLVATPFPLTRENREPKALWVKVPVYTVLVESPQGLVLFDTACHPDCMVDRWAEENKQLTPHFCTVSQQLPNVLKRLGYSPDDVNYVVVSHLHEDHGGCLEFFKKAKIFVHENEFDQTMRKYALKKDMGGYIWKDIDQWIKADLNWELVSADDDMIEIVPNVHILNLGSGHTPGLLGLLVSLPNTGNIILTSDAISTAENYKKKFPGIIYDSQGFLKCVDKVQKLQKKYNAQVWFSHDLEQYNTLVKSDDGFYD